MTAPHSLLLGVWPSTSTCQGSDMPSWIFKHDSLWNERQLSPTLHPDQVFLKSVGQTVCQRVFSGFDWGGCFQNPLRFSAKMFQQQFSEKFQSGLPGISMTVLRPSMEMIAMIPGFQWTFSFSLWVLPTWLSKNDSLPALVEFEFAMTLKVMEGNVSLNVNMGSTSQMVHEQMRGSVGRWWTALRQLQDASYWAEDGSSANWEHPQQEYGVALGHVLRVSESRMPQCFVDTQRTNQTHQKD